MFFMGTTVSTDSPKGCLMSSFIVFSYFGPETTMPLASALATVLGGVLLLGRSALVMAKTLLRRVFRLNRDQ